MAVRPATEMQLRVVIDMEYSGSCIDYLLMMRRKGGFPMSLKKEITHDMIKGKTCFIDVMASCSATKAIKCGPEWVQKMCEG